MKIAASIYSSHPDKREGLIHLLDAHGIDYIHIDCNDNPDVFKDIAEIRKLSDTPIDLHLISARPEKYYPLIKEYHIESVTLQYENLDKIPEIPYIIGTSFGLSITTDTPVSVFKHFENAMDFILLMATVPGKSGGVFDRRNFRKIHEIHQLFPGTQIHVDGGVNDELSFILRHLNVRMIVVGSYLFNNDNLGIPLLNLKKEKIHSSYPIKDFMQTHNLPLLPREKADFYSILSSIEKHNLGFTIITGPGNYMEGLITNADIRRAMLKHFHKLPSLSVDEIINTDPVFIREDKTVKDLIKLVDKITFPLLFLPVTNEKKQVVGVLMFNNLIKGES